MTYHKAIIARSFPAVKFIARKFPADICTNISRFFVHFDKVIYYGRYSVL